ncbi:hypothetical protein FYK55_17670 [Roseiconus nitratireducens]|uniref:Lipocalin-like protein n=1 Tax=Roseiconus nitratireducens TaxID=2605748 RepID=A0A5M6D1K8_9BACT|nr:hypothetical protein [Roseiconus nitratireducens]KAA5541397.1 hypothetical protein FYK55_17670 [Roseiconus nitratireducens]
MFRPALLTLAFVFIMNAPLPAAEPLTLMGTLQPWLYPKATMDGAEMSDAETIDVQGNRTRPSVRCKTIMKTPDGAEKVLEFYREKLKSQPDGKPVADDKLANWTGGRSVTYHEGEDDRSVKVYVILVNQENATTSLVISRGEDEDQTHIQWTHYQRI